MTTLVQTFGTWCLETSGSDQKGPRLARKLAVKGSVETTVSKSAESNIKNADKRSLPPYLIQHPPADAHEQHANPKRPRVLAPNGDVNEHRQQLVRDTDDSE